MDESDVRGLMTFLKDEDVKIVWREEDRTKVGRGKITHDFLDVVMKRQPVIEGEIKRHI